VKSLVEYSAHALVAAVLLNLLGSAAVASQRSGRLSNSINWQKTLDYVRFLLLMAVYTCAGMVCWSFWADMTLKNVSGKTGKGYFHNPSDSELILPVPSASATVVHVVRIATLFFGTQLAICFACVAQRIVPEWHEFLQFHIDTATEAVMFCPMVAGLFVTVRLRSLQVTEGLGGAQSWMFLVMRIMLIGLYVRLATSMTKLCWERKNIPEDCSPFAPALLPRRVGQGPDVARAFLVGSTMCIFLNAVVLVLGLSQLSWKNATDFFEQ
jgi:hypothetical protein